MRPVRRLGGVLALGTAVIVLALLWQANSPAAGSIPDASPGPARASGVAPPDLSAPLVGAPASAEAPDRHEEAPRTSASVPTSEMRVQAWLKVHTLPSGDNGIDHCIRAIRDALAHPEQHAFHVPTTEEVVGNRDLNPLRLELSGSERSELGGLLAEYQLKISRLNLDSFLETWMANAGVASTGACERTPNPANFRQSGGELPPEARAEQQQARDAVRKKYGEDAVVTIMPGPDMSYLRIVALTGENAPEFWRAYQQVVAEKAELQVAVRTFFLQHRR